MAQTETISAFWLKQQRSLDQRLLPLLEGKTDVVLLDYPVYSNIGDLLIYLGTMTWFQRHSVGRIQQWNLYQFSFPPLGKDTVIFLQGGGNFGDLYKHQAFREKVTARYPENRIVFLPQTIWYTTEKALQDTRRALNHHPDLHLLLRDVRSLQIAQESFAKAHCALCPDMACNLFPLEETLGMDATDPIRNTAAETMCLMRTDIEARPDRSYSLDRCTWHGDWRELLGPRFYQVRGWQVAARLLPGWLGGQSFAHQWQRVARGLASRAARRLASSDHVITSRLHGHILASLAGVPNTLLDNTYGKNSGYLKAWHGELVDIGLTKLVD